MCYSCLLWVCVVMCCVIVLGVCCCWRGLCVICVDFCRLMLLDCCCVLLVCSLVAAVLVRCMFRIVQAVVADC